MFTRPENPYHVTINSYGVWLSQTKLKERSAETKSNVIENLLWTLLGPVSTTI